MQEEIWKEIPLSGGIYYVSNLCNIKSIDHYVLMKPGLFRIQKGRMIKLHKSRKGYIMCSIKKNGKNFHTSIHRLIAICFIPNIHNKDQVNHINGIKDDNRIGNLEWCTNRENIIHAYSNDLIKVNKGEKHHNSKITDMDELTIFYKRKNGASYKSLSLEYGLSIQAIQKRVINNLNKNKTK